MTDMNFEDYVRHMTQKYRVAVAIAVVKNKPENLSVDQYITQLRAEVGKEMESDDLDITICSDDFEYNVNLFEKGDDKLPDSQQTNASPTILDDFCFEIDEHEGNKEINHKTCISSLELSGNENEELVQNKVHIKSGNILQNQILNHPELNLSFTSSIPSVINNDILLTKDIFVNIDKDNLCNQQIIENNIPMIQGDDKLDETDLNKTYVDTQQTELYNVHGFTQDCSHVSQTQDVDFVISDQCLRKKVIKIDLAKFDNHNPVSDYTADKDTIIYKDDPKTEKIDNQNLSQNAQNFDIEDNDDTYTILNKIDILNQRLYKNDEGDIAYKNTEIMKQDGDEEIIKVLRNISEDEFSSSQEEVVPFKVIEELNKIKNYLYRRIEGRASSDGCSTDSGYRSNSQRKSTKISLQLSDNWLNQSAHSLFDYITRCPLVATTHDICQEISQVLGNIIDQLNDDENYPSFLELLLEYVDTTLRYILEVESSANNLLLKRDECIHRLLLLNKSMHIIKYTIEKVTNILEKVHLKLTSKENLYEIINISETENICYLFHILEVLLKRYTKRKKVFSQNSTQASQDDEKFPKMSAITDIWRKKWNPNYKEKVNIEGSFEKKCVTVKCTEVLNKMIVECMDGYSLVAFAALQCFNLLQS